MSPGQREIALRWNRAVFSHSTYAKRGEPQAKADDIHLGRDWRAVASLKRQGDLRLYRVSCVKAPG